MKTEMTAYSDSDRVLNFIKGAARETPFSNEKFGYVDAVDLLDDLLRIERENFDIAIRFRMNDGAMIVYQGFARALIFQTQRHVRLALWHRGDDFEANIKFLLESNSELGSDAHQDDYDQWRLTREGVTRVLQHLETLPKPKKLIQTGKPAAAHPRNFSVEDRRAAWAEFESAGSYCPGVDRPRHKLSLTGGDRIEYDHLIPYSEMGASSLNNLRILCSACNRRKSNRIL